MKPTRHPVRLIAAAASTLATMVLFQSMAMLAAPSPATLAAQSQATTAGRTTSMGPS